jgi:hypothetical protein
MPDMADSSMDDGRPDPETVNPDPDRRRTIDLVRVERGEPERRNLRSGQRRNPLNDTRHGKSSGEDGE